jgi:hypothetical protein
VKKNESAQTRTNHTDKNTGATIQQDQLHEDLKKNKRYKQITPNFCVVTMNCTMLFDDTSKQGVVLDVVLKHGDYLKGWISAETEIRYLSKPVSS